MGGSAIGNTLKLMVVKSHHPSCTSLVHSFLGHLSIYFEDLKDLEDLFFRLLLFIL